jgi:hypothetical protein
MLLLGEIVLGIALSAGAVWFQRPQAGLPRLGDVATAIIASFGLAALLGEGLVPGFWMIGNYALRGGRLEDYVLPGAGVAEVVRALAIGLLLSTYASIRAYVSLIRSRRRR